MEEFVQGPSPWERLVGSNPLDTGMNDFQFWLTASSWLTRFDSGDSQLWLTAHALDSGKSPSLSTLAAHARYPRPLTVAAKISRKKNSPCGSC